MVPMTFAAGLRRVGRVTLNAIAIGYPATLLLSALALRLLGEHWWLSGAAIFLPRWGLALPLPLVVGLVLWAKRRRLLWLQLASAWLLLFPLMGLTLPSLPSSTTGPKLRVLSYNANSNYGGVAAIAAEIESYDPDVVVVQELFMGTSSLQEALRARYPYINTSSQFLLASKRPISKVVEPPQIPFFGKLRSPRFMQYELETALGPLTLFSVHPVSPRGGIQALRGSGLSRELPSGRLFRGETSHELQATAALREAQIRTVTELAAAAKGPVVIAGDLNLPHLSPIFARYLSDYRDGFVQSSSGFGYTYPTKLPWMRLDRVLTNDALRFSHFEVGKSRASDHFCVVADVVKATP